MSPAVLAFGGNALLPDPFHPEEQETRARELAAAVRLLLERSNGLVLVHGNGPQVGMILLRVEATRERLPAEPLDILVAETQGSVGTMLSRVLRDALRAHGSPFEVTPILTQVVVDPADRAFDEPTKPIGPHYDEAEARSLRAKRGWKMVEETTRGWRRVVASPRPRRVLEMASIRAAVEAGHIVIAGGGGGVPVCEDADGRLAGVEAVIDKDRTAALLARSLDAETFAILTGVPHVSRNFGTPEEERIAVLPLAEGRAMLADGVFPRGSMRPKIEAACDYVAQTGRPTLITDAQRLSPALEGLAGTQIVP